MLTLIWIILATNHLIVLGTNLMHIPCDDKVVEKLSRLATTYINEDRQTGYKFALNRISNVQAHPQGPAGKVYYLDLDVLETKCHVLSPKSWKKCAIRPFMETQISGNCNTTVLHTPEGFSYLYNYDCTLVPDPPEKLQLTCPDCPLLLPVDSDEAISTARITLLKYNKQSTLPVSLTVDTITRASHQRYPVSASFVEYTIQECSIAPFPEVLCEPGHKGKEPIGFCVGEVLGTNQDVKVSCEMFRPQVHAVTPTQHKEISTTFSKTLAHDIHTPHIPAPSFQNIKPGTHQLADPVHQAVPTEPRLHPVSVTTSSSESNESDSDSDSSEEVVGSVRVAKPPLNFRYVLHRQRRQTPTGTTPPPKPTFLSVFPSIPSPFRSCPGVSRYTTV